MTMSGPGIKKAPPWKQARPGEATARQDPTSELLTVITTDISCDKARRKVVEMCKDYGLVRVQWSVFEGRMTRNRREEIVARLKATLEKPDVGGRIAVYVIGAREAEWAERWSAPVAVKVGGSGGRT